jgi:hypothetical protein
LVDHVLEFRSHAQICASIVQVNSTVFSLGEIVGTPGSVVPLEEDSGGDVFLFIAFLTNVARKGYNDFAFICRQNFSASVSQWML